MQGGRSIPFLGKKYCEYDCGYVTFLRDILARQLTTLRALCDAIPGKGTRREAYRLGRGTPAEPLGSPHLPRVLTRYIALPRKQPSAEATRAQPLDRGCGPVQTVRPAA
jgi:hypothetical protein